MTVDLGIIDDGDNMPLGSNHFPSKVGGKPAWLDFEHIPEPSVFVCQFCHKPRIFLCQLYCPIDGNPQAFHRTIFIFICLTENCFSPNSNRNFIVFRSQLSRENNYYSHEPPKLDDDWCLEKKCELYNVRLCGFCGVKSSLVCEQCLKSFCGDHRDLVCVCKKSFNLNDVKATPTLPEYGVNIERDDCSDDETDDEDTDTDSDCESVRKRMDEFNSYIRSRLNSNTQNDSSIENYFSDFICEDNYFEKFKSEISREPKQIVRYGRDTEPLWICEKNILISDDVPLCPYCGTKRQFEFQILPQMLNYLKLDTGDNRQSGILDWGTLVVYTCKESCNNGPAYKEEYLWKQDIV